MQTDSSLLWLVAEDCDDDFFLLQRACARLTPPPKLRRASNGVEARQYLAGDGPFEDRAAHPLPSRVVSDLKMPLMDGLELLAWFKNQPRKLPIPFVLLTGSDEQRDRDRARDYGVDQYLTKPSTFGELVSLVASI